MRPLIPDTPLYWACADEVVTRSNGRCEAITWAQAMSLHRVLLNRLFACANNSARPYLSALEEQLRMAMDDVKTWKRAA